MNPDAIRETLFGTPWQRCHVQLSSGETFTLEHPDWALMSPHKTFLIIVLANESYRVIEPHHIVSLQVERQPGPQPNFADTPVP